MTKVKCASKQLSDCENCDETYCQGCSDAEEKERFCSKACEQDPDADDAEDEGQLRREFEREEVRAMNRDLARRRGEL